jgi:hypothetical protein
MAATPAPMTPPPVAWTNLSLDDRATVTPAPQPAIATISEIRVRIGPNETGAWAS